MIGYITLGTNDMEKSVGFYDGLFEIIGAKKAYNFERFVGWTVGEAQQMFAVVKPFDGNDATPGNGTMIALKVKDENMVKQVHAKALAQGGTCEGEPGVRQDSYYCGYCRDLDGNKLNFYCPL
ncbi:VOC family protein [Pseudomonadota bacterium]